ncbi:MAG: NOL1/NOP2/sun family putative RNA methylase [Clostridia bacterium]|nr:NOL1/NOP2/sun family putative RNA methylase [Clostridia bacterium]
MLPERFKERMIALLGEEEAGALFRSIENVDPIKAFRVNGIKTDVDSFEQALPEIDREKVKFPPNAYITREAFPGSLPCHHSGAIYMQDISAMSTVYAAKVEKGDLVLDSCSAPGGKTTQLAELAGEDGIVVANEYEKKRCRILQSNVERLGCKNTVVCNLDTAVLAEHYPNVFDLVLCDAPCSGEGMFRKNERAIEEWSEENVLMCAERQREILGNVAKCVKSGGRLVYSTCTFSPEEDEMNVKWFLDMHPEYVLTDAMDALVQNTSDGIMLEGCSYDMTKCRRIWPHASQGEGQFIAVFEKSNTSDENICGKPQKDKKGKKQPDQKRSRTETEAIAAAHKFLKENLIRELQGELVLLGEYVYLKPNIQLPPFGVFTAGVCIGELQKGRFVPHHQLFSAYGKEFKRRLELSGDDYRTEGYLKGEEIPCEDQVVCDAEKTGWAAVLIDGCPTGGGKISGSVCKNHYPKGLRNQN